MMLEIHNGLGNPMKIPATRIVIMDDMGNPVSFAISFNKDINTGREHIRICDAMDKDFENQLKLNGIKNTVVVDRIYPESK